MQMPWSTWTKVEWDLIQLHIHFYKGLKSLAEGIHPFSTQQTLTPFSCVQTYQKDAKRKTSKDWPKIAHVPKILMDHPIRGC